MYLKSMIYFKLEQIYKNTCYLPVFIETSTYIRLKFDVKKKYLLRQYWAKSQIPSPLPLGRELEFPFRTGIASIRVSHVIHWSFRALNKAQNISPLIAQGGCVNLHPCTSEDTTKVTFPRWMGQLPTVRGNLVRVKDSLSGMWKLWH